MNMSYPAEIFRSYDIRGLMEQLSVDLARQIGAAIASETGAKTVVVGRDMRETSPEFSKAVIEGIRGVGANAVDIGQCSTSMFNFAVSAYSEHEAGVMVTASHNPAEYNGFKMYDGAGMPISGEQMKEWSEKEYPSNGEGELSELNIETPYLDKLFSLVEMPSLEGLKVVVDAGNGMGGIILPALFERLNCEMVPMYFEPDGRFPNHEANPIKEETLDDLRAKVAETGAHMGIALDGDADRVGFTDEHGQSVPGDITLALLADVRLADVDEGILVQEPRSSWVLEEIANKHGAQLVMDKAGRTGMIKTMKKTNATIGGEMSSHFFFPELSYLESTDLVILEVLEKLARSGGSFSELLKPYRKYTSSGEHNFEIDDKDGLLKNALEKYQPEANKLIDVDGIRLEFDDWWFNLRKSNTEPLIRLNLEAKTKELMEEKFQEISDFIKSHV